MSSVYSRDAWLDDSHSVTHGLDDYPEQNVVDGEGTLQRSSLQRMQMNESEYIPRGPRHYASTEPINVLPILPTSNPPSKEPIVYIVGWKLVLLLVGYVLGPQGVESPRGRRVTGPHHQGFALYLSPKSRSIHCQHVPRRHRKQFAGIQSHCMDRCRIPHHIHWWVFEHGLCRQTCVSNSTGYDLTYSSGFIIIWAKLSDILMRKWSLIASLAIFIAASGACGGAQSMTMLLVVPSAIPKLKH